MAVGIKSCASSVMPVAQHVEVLLVRDRGKLPVLIYLLAHATLHRRPVGATVDCSAFGRALGSVSDAMVSAIRGPCSAAASGLRLFVVRGLMLTGGEGVCACVCCCGH